jgi:hypothetical protein
MPSNINSKNSSKKKTKFKNLKNVLLLPKPDKPGSLHKYGYSLSNSKLERQKSLKKASRKKSSLKILKRLTLIHNITSKNLTENRKKLETDMAYASKLYREEKEKK